MIPSSLDDSNIRLEDKLRDLGFPYPLKSRFVMADKDNPFSESQFLPSPIAREYLTSDDKRKRIKAKHWFELNGKNNQIRDLERDIASERWINELKQDELKDKVNALSTLLGAGAGGLGGYGLASLMTKNKWLKALGALGGGVAGGIIGNKLNPVNKKHASENKITNMNNKFAKNINSDKQKSDVYADAYKTLYDKYYKGLNTNVPSYEYLDSQIDNYLKTNKVPNDILLQALINDVKGSSNGITDKSELRKNLLRTAYKGMRSGVNTKNNIVSGLVGLLGAGLGSGLGYMLGKNNKVPMTIGGGILGGSLAGYLAKKSMGTPEDALKDQLLGDYLKLLKD